MEVRAATIRHLVHDLIFVAHEARYLDKNILGYCNLFILKYPGMMSVKFERPEIREVVLQAQNACARIIGRACSIKSLRTSSGLYQKRTNRNLLLSGLPRRITKAR